MRTKLYALIAVVGLLGVALGPGVTAAAASTSGNAAANEPLSVGVTQDDGVVVEVTRNGSGVGYATVTVAVEGNGTYDGTGTYGTGTDGTVYLPSPSENVTVSVTASADNQTASTTAELVADGTNADAFGQRVSAYVHSLLSSGERGIGQFVSEFARENNPGKAPEHAGPPDHAGADDGNATANGSDGDERGPPEHAGNDGKDAGKNDDEKGGGPPAHAGNDESKSA